MSQTSEAFAKGTLAWSMRNAVPILFWSAILLVLISAGMTVSEYWGRLENDSTSAATRRVLLFNGLRLALSEGVWPFVGAGIIWTLQSREAEAAE